LHVVLYEMLTGEWPTENVQPLSKRVQIDICIDEVVLRALEVKAELRYQTAVDFRTTVERLKGGDVFSQSAAAALIRGFRFRLTEHI